MKDTEKCPLKRLCEHCNKEFDVTEYSETYDTFVASIMNCPHCGKRNDIWVTVIKSTLYEDEEDITLETQNRIRDLVIKKSGADDGVIDGSGCDSGDPVDLTLDEISQGFNYLLDEVIEPLKNKLAKANDKIRRWEKAYL